MSGAQPAIDFILRVQVDEGPCIWPPPGPGRWLFQGSSVATRRFLGQQPETWLYFDMYRPSGLIETLCYRVVRMWIEPLV